MATFLVTGTILVTDFPGTNPGDTFTLTVTTDGFSGVCTVANGHLISVTGNIDGTGYDITADGGYPASPTFNSVTNGLTGQGALAASVFSLSGAIFTYNPASFTLAGENNFASGSILKRCLL